MGSTSSFPQDKHIVVVGGGYGGVQAALALRKGGANFTIIDINDAFHHCLASVRAVTVPGFAEKTLIPFKETFKNRFLQGEVIDLDPSKKSLVVRTVIPDPDDNLIVQEHCQEVSYDVLILATGSRQEWPLKFGRLNRANALDKYADYVKKVEKSKSIVIVGGGPSGCEVAGELAHKYPDKDISIVNAHEKLLNNSELSDAYHERLVAALEQMKIKLILGEKIVNLDNSETVSGKDILLTDKDRTIEADMVIKCTGARVNASAYSDSLGDWSEMLVEKIFFSAHAKEENGQLKVNEYFQVKDYKNIFAIGDCCNTAEFKLGYLAGLHGERVARNLKRFFKGERMKPYLADPLPATIIMSLGPMQGLGQLKNGYIVGNLFTRKIKSSHLCTRGYWKAMEQEEPELTAMDNI